MVTVAGKFWVGSLWHRDCDPFVTVIALSERECEKRLAQLAQEEWDSIKEDAFGEGESEEIEYDICASGAALVADLGGVVGEMSMNAVLQGLIDDGWVTV